MIINVNNEDAGKRLDSFISENMTTISRSLAQKLIENNEVKVNNEIVKASYKVKEDDSIFIDEGGLKSDSSDLKAENIPLDILYEDEDILVVNKPKNMVVHPGSGVNSGTLVNALLYHCGSLSVINGEERPGIVHRIDKDTSGLLVCAKSDEAYRGLQKQFSEHSITRVYRAVVYFGFDEDSGTVDAPIGRDPKNRLKMAIVNDGKRAVTHWRVRERFKGFTEIEARLETGRTHQIRVHMTSINHPLLGDEVYGNVKKHPYKTEGQMLHAGILGFVHPISGQFMEFTSEPPDIYLDTLQKIKNK